MLQMFARRALHVMGLWATLDRADWRFSIIESGLSRKSAMLVAFSIRREYQEGHI